MKGVSGFTFQVSSSTVEVEEEPTPTQKIWRPVSDLNEAHLQALRELQSAVTRGDEVGAKKAHDAIQYIEMRQARVHAEARNYLVRKASGSRCQVSGEGGGDG